MAEFIRGKHPNLYKVVFELRYRYGYTFLDRCGKTMNAIMRASSEWIPSDQVSPQNSPLLSLKNGCLFTFNSSRMDFAIEQSLEPETEAIDVDYLLGQVGLLPQIVIDQLGLTEFSRIGYREWYLFNCANKSESQKWLENLSLYHVSDQLKKAFGKGQVEAEATDLTVIIVGEDRKFRIAFSGVERAVGLNRGSQVVPIKASTLHKDQDKVFKERQKKKHLGGNLPLFASMIDFDAFQDEPITVDPRDFAATSHGEFLTRLRLALSKE